MKKIKGHFWSPSHPSTRQPVQPVHPSTRQIKYFEAKKKLRKPTHGWAGTGGASIISIYIGISINIVDSEPQTLTARNLQIYFESTNLFRVNSNKIVLQIYALSSIV